MMSFANQALSVKYIIEQGKKLEPKVNRVPEEIDRAIAKLALDTMSIRIDALTNEQIKYLKSWELGTL